MNPDQNQPEYSVDYLNQISPNAGKRSDGPFTKIFIGLGIVTLLVIVLLVIVGATRSQTPSLDRFAARLTNTKTVVDGAQNNLINGKLRNANSNLSLYLTNAARELTPLLEAKSIKIDKLPEKVSTSEDVASLTETLENARLNGNYDSVYSREIAYKLETVLYLAKQLRESVSDEKTKIFLAQIVQNLQPLQTELASYAKS